MHKYLFSCDIYAQVNLIKLANETDTKLRSMYCAVWKLMKLEFYYIKAAFAAH